MTALVELPAIIADLLSPQVHSTGSGDGWGAQRGYRFSHYCGGALGRGEIPPSSCHHPGSLETTQI